MNLKISQMTSAGTLLGSDKFAVARSGSTADLYGTVSGVLAYVLANTPAGSGDMVASAYDPQGIEDDAFARANHTGTQAISTVTGLQTALDGKAAASHTHTLSQITDAGSAASADAGSFAAATHTHDVGDIDATGTADGTTFLRGDGTWATPVGGGEGGGIANVVDDPSPELGGDLVLNGNSITGLGSIEIDDGTVPAAAWVFGANTPIRVSYNDDFLNFSLNVASDTAGHSAVYFAERARGTTDAPAAVQTGDYLGRWQASGYDGTNFRVSGVAGYRVSGTPGAGSVGGAFFIQTGTASGNQTDRIVVDHLGAITFNGAYSFPTTIGTAGQGLVVPASGTTLEWSSAAGGGIDWTDPVDANIVPDADGTRNLGSAVNAFGVGYFDLLVVNGVAFDGDFLEQPGAPSVYGGSEDPGWLGLSGLSITGGNLVPDVTLTNTATLTNKTINGNNNTISNLEIGAEVSGTLQGNVTLNGFGFIHGIRTITGQTDTLVLGDRSKVVRTTHATSTVVTIPLNASVPFSVGSYLLVRRSSAGTATITAASGVLLNGVSGGSCTVQTQNQAVTLIKTSTDAWETLGDASAVV